MLLTERKFLPLFLTQFLGALNDNLLKMAIITFITYHLQGSLTEKGILISSVNVIAILPMFFISATAGQFADKFQRNSLVKIIKGMEIVGILLCIFFFYSDRKSTRLNSSHANISYAVFCLKKKNITHSTVVALSASYPQF